MSKYLPIRMLVILMLAMGVWAGVTQVQAKQPAVLSIESGGTAGRITVPVDQSQLLKVDQRFSEINVGNKDIAEVVPLSRNLVYVLGKKMGTTNLTIRGSGGNIIAVVDVVVSYDIAGLQNTIRETMPNESIEIRPAGGAILLQGKVSSVNNLNQIVAIAERYAPKGITNMLSVGGSQQVLLEVRFAEVQRTALQQFGINSDSTINSGNDVISLLTGGGIAADSFGAIGGTLNSGPNSYMATIDALEQKGIIRTLAEPNLVALSGDTASFLAGGEIPIPVAQNNNDSGGPTITVEFKEFGVGLSFTPTVIATELINLEVKSEVSSIDESVSFRANDIEIPGFKVRRTKTTVELKDGQTFAIAGLIQDDFQDGLRQLPGLGDLPILGALFRSNNYKHNQTELVVIVTVHLVEPGTGQRVASPSDTLVLPNHAEFYGMGKLEGMKSQAPQPDQVAPVDDQAKADKAANPEGYVLP